MRRIAVAVALFTTTAAIAQDSSIFLEEIVVSARKTGELESMQDVSLAVTAFGAAQLEAAFVRDIEGLSFAAPNVSLDSVGVTPGVQNFAIRGLGLNSSIPSIDPTVGLFVDEVYLGVTFGVVLDMFDLEGVEILRGPQGLLFGRNVTGGAVLVRTKRPTQEFTADFKAAVETGPEYILGGSIGGAITPSLAAKLTAYYKNDDGYFDNVVTGDSDYGAERTVFVRPSFLLTPTDNSEFLLRLEHGETTGDGGVVQNTDFYKDFDTGVGSQGSVDIQWDQVFLEANWDVAFGNGKITNIFGWRDLEHSGYTDVDGQQALLFHGGIRTLQEQFSNELRYSGSPLQAVDLTTGLFYFTQDILYREERTLANGALQSTLGGDQDHWTWAAFAAADVAVSDALTLNLGVRYTKEHKEAQVATFNALQSPCSFATNECTFDFRDEQSWENWIPKVGFEWRPLDDVLLYSFWTKGVRSGGYNFRNVNPLVAAGPTKEEKQDSFEFGIKSDLADHRLRLNVAAFYNDIADLQREVVTVDPVAGVAQVIRNSADARIRGVEVEATFAPIDALAFSAAVGYTDAEYTRIHMDLTADGVIDAADKALELPRVSPWTYNAAVTYALDLGSLGATAWRVQYSHRDESPFTDSNSTFLSEVDLLDASVSYTPPGGRFKISLYGRNLTDEDYEGAVTPLPFGTVRYLSKGRRYGVETSFSF
ncbi:MAG TPA: TonB-dependent receptor [Steroidobacter sp.]|jgi:iron complex outermembrane receptor protein|nr:TonB-dependent receptor [Steroidobacteraceae bacterium]HLS81269.1 TonB-dependent receptor [Steroidobacter sp.]